MKRLTGEASVKRAVEDLLDLYKIPHWRMNAGDRYGTYNGKTWRIKGHASGTADILAAPRVYRKQGFGIMDWELPYFFWIECKRPDGGKQSDEQVTFQARVEEQGHYYVLASSVDDVIEVLKNLGIKI